MALDDDIPWFRIFIGCAFFLLGIFFLAWMIQGNGFFMYKYFAPKEEAVRRETFEQSKAYNEGMAQDLQQLELDYLKADKDQKQAIESIALHKFAGYDTSKLSPDLREFLSTIKRNHMGDL